MTEKKRSALMNFLFPKITLGYCVRLICVAAIAYGFFGYLCKPAIVRGASMEPAYHDGMFVFCWTPAFWRRKPSHGDVVMIRYGSDRVMLLKRVLAVEGDGAHGRDNAEVFAPFGASSYFLCVSARRPDLLAKLNEAQADLALNEPNFLHSLCIKYFPKSISARNYSPA